MVEQVKPQATCNMHACQGCRKVVKSGGGNISDYVLLVVLYTSRGGLGACPPEHFWYFCALRQLLVQSDANTCLTGCFIDIDGPS